MTIEDAPPPTPDAPAPEGRRGLRIVWKVLIGIAAVVVVLVVAALVWFFVLRDQAGEVSTDSVLEDFRSSGGTASEAEGLPAAGVYEATATGTESIGIPGLDESFGPNAPVTVTHDGDGCFTYRVDLNTHHWRTWSFCPSGEATFALTGLQSATTRDVPGLDLDDLTTYTCATPVPYLWSDPQVGDTRSGACTGSSDTISGTTRDAATVEVLAVTTLDIGGTSVPVVHVRSTDTFTEAQTGTEVDEWWLDASTGLPLRLVIDARLSSAVGDYTETATIELTSLVPAT